MGKPEGGTRPDPQAMAVEETTAEEEKANATRDPKKFMGIGHRKKSEPDTHKSLELGKEKR